MQRYVFAVTAEGRFHPEIPFDSPRQRLYRIVKPESPEAPGPKDEKRATTLAMLTLARTDLSLETFQFHSVSCEALCVEIVQDPVYVSDDGWRVYSA